MSNQKYIFNPSTLQYEKDKKTTKQRLYQVVKYASSVAFTALLLFALAYYFFPTPKERALKKDMTQMEYYYKEMADRYDALTAQLDDIQRKDADVHRMVFGMEPIDENVWNGGVGGREKPLLLRSSLSANELLNATLEKLEKLNRKVDMQQESMGDLLSAAEEHADRIASIPSIKPVQEDKLKRKVKLLSGYGMRMHPVHKVRKMHQGIDFTAPKGTPIIATGNGKVIRVEHIGYGYGTSVLIDHGYGYQTLYGHMSKVDVKKGEKVQKGQVIGTVGSTGTSTAPHCHYEVRINGKPVDPIDYVLDGLTSEEFQDLVKKASEENQSLD